MAEAAGVATPPKPGSVWFANGTTALHVALRALDCRGRLVAVPPNVCPNVIAAIFTSGNRPLFVDIERVRFGLDPARLLDIADSAGAIVSVHAYGIPSQIDEIARVAASRGVPLIEDCAQAEGASYRGAKVGSFGDVAVFSYGAGKIVAAGGGGRAVARDAEITHRLRAEAERLPETTVDHVARRLSTEFKELYNRAYPDDLAPHRERFAAFLTELGGRLLAPATAEIVARCEARMGNIASIAGARRRKAELYASLLADEPGVQLLRAADGSIPWRFNVWLEPDCRARVFQEMLSRRVPVSTWYPDISRFLPVQSYESGACPNAGWLEKGVLNLWLDDATGESDVHQSARQLVELLNRAPATARTSSPS